MSCDLKKIFTKVVDWHNRLSDKDFIWFPFLNLKPKPDELMGLGRILLMTLAFSTYGVLFFMVKNLLRGQSIEENLARAAVRLLVGFFLWFQLVTSQLWNIRARALRAQKKVAIQD